MVALGGKHSVALTEGGALFTWGYGEYDNRPSPQIFPLSFSKKKNEHEGFSSFFLCGVSWSLYPLVRFFFAKSLSYLPNVEHIYMYVWQWVCGSYCCTCVQLCRWVYWSNTVGCVAVMQLGVLQYMFLCTHMQIYKYTNVQCIHTGMVGACIQIAIYVYMPILVYKSQCTYTYQCIRMQCMYILQCVCIYMGWL